MSLEQYLSLVRNRPFSWSGWTCCHLALGWLDAATGSHTVGAIAGGKRYHRRAYFGLGIPAIIGMAAGPRLRPVSRARPGDIVAVGSGRKLMAAIALGSGRFAVPCKYGLEVQDFHTAKHIWRIN
jgi:hypothetical protein